MEYGGQFFKAGMGVLASTVVGTVVIHNTVRNFYQIGIQFGTSTPRPATLMHVVHIFIPSFASTVTHCSHVQVGPSGTLHIPTAQLAHAVDTQRSNLTNLLCRIFMFVLCSLCSFVETASRDLLCAYNDVYNIGQGELSDMGCIYT